MYTHVEKVQSRYQKTTYILSIIDRNEHHSIKGTFCDGEASENNRRRLPQRARIQSALPKPWNIFVISFRPEISQTHRQLSRFPCCVFFYLVMKHIKKTNVNKLSRAINYRQLYLEPANFTRMMQEMRRGSTCEKKAEWQHLGFLSTHGGDKIHRKRPGKKYFFFTFSFLRLKYRDDCKPVQSDGFQQLPDTFF